MCVCMCLCLEINFFGRLIASCVTSSRATTPGYNLWLSMCRSTRTVWFCTGTTTVVVYIGVSIRMGRIFMFKT